MLTREDREVYMSLSTDRNERGRLWKTHPVRLNYTSKLVEEMTDYYDKQFIKATKRYDPLEALNHRP